MVLFSSGCGPLSSAKPTKEYEGYLPRRLTYQKDGADKVFAFFFVSNRQVDDLGDLPSPESKERSDQLRQGTFRVRTTPDLSSPGNNPYKWSGIHLHDVQEMAAAGFFRRLKEAIATSPQNSLLVIVYGYKELFESSALKTTSFAKKLDLNTPILLFDWPGNQGVSIGGDKRAFALARESGPKLGELLTEIIHQAKPQNLWLTGNSMGCQVICDAFTEMMRHSDLADRGAEIEHVLLAAPDVADDEFNDQFKNELAALSKDLTVYVSANDTALLLSSWIHGGIRLGRPKAPGQEQLEEMTDLLELEAAYEAEGIDDRINLIDITPVNDASHGHNYYLESPEYIEDFYQRLRTEPTVENRRLYRESYKKGIWYWILWDDED